jgi:phage terminase small subunit
VTPKQRVFVQEYLQDLNATRAYKAAGYSAQGHVAESAASRLLRNVEVASAVEKVLGRLTKKLEISADRVLQESARLAFFDIRKLYAADGSLKPMQDWDDDTAAAVSSVETVEQLYADGTPSAALIKKLRTWSKPGQLTLLARHLKLLHEEPAQSVVNILVNVQTSLEEALSRAYRRLDADR